MLIMHHVVVQIPSTEMLTLDGSVCPIAKSQQMANGRILLTLGVADLSFLSTWAHDVRAAFYAKFDEV